MPRMRLMLLSFLLCESGICQRIVPIQDPSDPHRARVSGVVLDERRRPAPGITVQAQPPGPLSAMLPHMQTDRDGRFALAGLLPGYTYVNAFDEERFYPDAGFNFWDGEAVAEVELPVAGELSGIVLTLKPVGRLQIIARNAADGASIDDIGTSLERDGEPNRSMGGGSMGNWWLAISAQPLEKV